MPDLNGPPIPVRGGGAFKSGSISKMDGGGGRGEDSPQSASGSGSQGRLFPPPPRHRASLSPGMTESITSNTPAQPLAIPSLLPTSKPAPPLPVRRSTVANTEDRRPALHKLVSPPAPPAPPAFDTNPTTPVSYASSATHSISSHTRDILSHILPHSHTPPPLHDPQHPHPKPHRKPLSLLPPLPTRTIGPGSLLRGDPLPFHPTTIPEQTKKILGQVPSSTCLTLRNPTDVDRYYPSGTGHTLRIYDLSLGGDTLVHVIELKDVGVKEGNICAVEFCPGGEGDRVWVGTKEGHIFVVDVRSGDVCTRRLGVHLYPITQIFRYGESMLTLDESGKTLIFSPSEEASGGLVNTLPVGESSSHGGHKIPIKRVFDPFNPASTGRSLIPTEHVGAVTPGTILSSHPGHVYLGHEEGFILICSLEESDYPRYIKVVKVSLSDVLCLEGVNDRLWAGGRNGMIAAYDVQCKPWVVRKCWTVHPGLPVVRLVVDYLGVEKGGCVWLVLDAMRLLGFGMGCLGWIGLDCVESPDIIAFGFQEVIDLEPRKMTAKNVLLGSKKKEDMGLSEKVTGAYRRWYDRLVSVVRASMPPDVKYSVVHTESLVGLFSCIFIKASERERLSDVAVTTVKRGMGGRYGNKGGIVARFVIGDSSVCIINSHLAAGQNAVRRRNADAASILEEKTVFPVAEHPLAYVGGGDGTMVLDHEIVFFHGDMNYRIEARRDAIIAAVRAGDYASLIPHDQLVRELKYNRAFRLRGFSEGPLTFAPTYKYDPRSNEYDTSEKHRSPAWCDRVLWRSRIPGRVRQVHYRRYEANVSDHRPVSAAFRITVKSLRRERREEIKRDIEGLWVVEQGRLLNDAREFYRSLALI
ncbi:Endonuclease/exonuclease/phosphatase [Cyathus striatus]|nr:Endonuclease/exonuclease/phosphatase [Cyathus striatus]